jgi:hypothetical protein
MIKDGRVVVVDYKFGDIEQPTYEAQVKRYITCLQDIGHDQVEGYLWYVSKNKIHPIFY